jgi:hypothetical protein
LRTDRGWKARARCLAADFPSRMRCTRAPAHARHHSGWGLKRSVHLRNKRARPRLDKSTMSSRCIKILAETQRRRSAGRRRSMSGYSSDGVIQHAFSSSTMFLGSELYSSNLY